MIRQRFARGLRATQRVGNVGLRPSLRRVERELRRIDGFVRRPMGGGTRSVVDDWERERRGRPDIPEARRAANDVCKRIADARDLIGIPRAFLIRLGDLVLLVDEARRRRLVAEGGKDVDLRQKIRVDASPARAGRSLRRPRPPRPPGDSARRSGSSLPAEGREAAAPAALPERQSWYRGRRQLFARAIRGRFHDPIAHSTEPPASARRRPRRAERRPRQPYRLFPSLGRPAATLADRRGWLAPNPRDAGSLRSQRTYRPAWQWSGLRLAQLGSHFFDLAIVFLAQNLIERSVVEGPLRAYLGGVLRKIRYRSDSVLRQATGVVALLLELVRHAGGDRRKLGGVLPGVVRFGLREGGLLRRNRRIMRQRVGYGLLQG